VLFRVEKMDKFKADSDKKMLDAQVEVKREII